jgi:hypothetical protein
MSGATGERFIRASQADLNSTRWSQPVQLQSALRSTALDRAGQQAQ